ncbi:MAG: hypothetical protein SYR96_08480 [Actinomycetota bacterium]|nr:hypothetical protein [Actinomycetota bacterium]
MRELLLTCHRVAAGDSTAVGVARRDYQPVGDLRLFGLFCEPVRAATGHAGAVTYLADSSGRVWVVSDVKPAEPSVALTATRASVDLGEARLSHHHLSRAGLSAINAHASAAGRLSHGRARQAVAAPGAGWFEEPLAALWRVSLTEQVGRWLAAAALPAHERPAAHDLAYLDGVVAGADRRGLLLAVGGLQVVAVGAPIEDPALPYVGNLRLLATRARGLPVRIAGRFTGAGTVDALALGAPWLPPSYGGHVDLGAQRLNRADVPAGPPGRNVSEAATTAPEPAAGVDGVPESTPRMNGVPEPDSGVGAASKLGPAGSAGQESSLAPTAGPESSSGVGAVPEPIAGVGAVPEPAPGMNGVPEPDSGVGAASKLGPAGSAGPESSPAPESSSVVGAAPPLHLVRHQLERVVATGRAALLSGAEEDARRLSAAHLVTAATVVRALGAAGVRRTRDVFGRLDPHDAERLADAWLTAAVYEQAATAEATRVAWGGGRVR